MSNTRIHARNLGANWLANGASLVTMFFLSPFVVNTLGPVEYGIWTLLNVLTGYMGVLDLGIRASTGRHILLYLGSGNHAAVDGTIRTSMGFYSGLGGIMLLAGLGIGKIFPSVISGVPPEYHELLLKLFPLMALNIWLSALAAVFSSVLTAHDRFDLARGVDIIVLLMQTICMVVVLKLGAGLVGMALVFLGCNLLGLAGNGVLAWRVYPRLRIWPLSFSRTRLKELLDYGLAAFITSVAQKIIGQTSVLMAGITVKLGAVTVFDVGSKLVYYSDPFLGQINNTMFPSIQRSAARHEIGPTRWLYLRTGRLSMLFGVLFYAGVIVFAEPFIRLWMLGKKFGEESVHQAAIIMIILACSKLPLLFVGASAIVLNALGRVRLTAGLALLEAAVNLGLALFFVLALDWGLAGIALGTLAARLLVGTFILPWQTCRALRLSFRHYLWQIGGRDLVAAGLAVMFFGALRRVIPTVSWTGFLLQICMAVLIYLPIAWWILITRADRLRVREKIRGRLGNKMESAAR